jgi:hypothetical protein
MAEFRTLAGQHTSNMRVFVSYAREDSSFVLRLARSLKDQSVSVWIDQWEIAPGADWTDSIEVALRSCTHFLIVLSPASVRSKEVRNELNYALAKGKSILPVKYKECEPPFRIIAIQYVDFVNRNYEDGLAELVRRFGVTFVSQAAGRFSIPPPVVSRSEHGAKGNLPASNLKGCVAGSAAVSLIMIVGIMLDAIVNDAIANEPGVVPLALFCMVILGVSIWFLRKY